MAETAAVAQEDSAQRTFSVSILISAIRCTLTYLVFPLLAPLLGLASGVGPTVGLIIGLVAIGANALSIRRFWRANHRWRWHMTALNSAVIVLLTILVVIDLRDLTGG